MVNFILEIYTQTFEWNKYEGKEKKRGVPELFWRYQEK